jgi:hypothetical protein
MTLAGGGKLTLKATIGNLPADATWTIPGGGASAEHRLGGLGQFPQGTLPGLAGGPTVGYQAPIAPFPVQAKIQARCLAGGSVMTAEATLTIMPPPQAPQGKLAYSLASALYEIDIATGQRRTISRRGEEIARRTSLFLFSDIGTAFGGNDPGPSLFRLQGSGPVVEMLHRDSIAFAFAYETPQISPTGDLVAVYQFGTNPAQPQSSCSVWTYVYLNKPKLNAEGPGRSFCGKNRPAWLPASIDAPLGRLLLISDPAGGYTAGNLYLSDAFINKLQPLNWNTVRYSKLLRVMASPDGSKLAVVTASGSLYVAAFDGTRVGTVKLLQAANKQRGLVVREPTWSSDGKWLAYQYDFNLFLPATATVFLRKADGGGPVFIIPANIGSKAAPLVAPLYVSLRQQMIWSE